MKNLRNLTTKDKMLIAKAVADIATEIYKSQNSFILNQINKNGKYESEFGQFWKQTTEAKTVEEILNKKKEDLEKLQNEIAKLETLNKADMYTEERVVLYSKHTEEADLEAKALLEDLLANLESKRLDKAASKH